jgi:hypothetical protein
MKIRGVFTLLALLVIFAGPSFAAGVDGTWVGQFAPDMNLSNSHPFVLDLKTDGSALTGTMWFCHPDCTQAPTGKVTIENGKVDGEKISFTIMTDASDVPQIDFQGMVEGDSISFVLSGKAPNCSTASCPIGHGSASRSKQ